MYNDTHGNPAGDYLGTITQMDKQIGRLRDLLHGTPHVLWLTADNGPHPGSLDGVKGTADVHTTTNGLRQCKASVYEGGIRVPGMIESNVLIGGNRETNVPVSTVDFLPTMLELMNVTHPHPHWARDGESILSLIRGKHEQRSQPLAWQLGEQLAYLSPDGRYKGIYKPSAGQCTLEKGSFSKGNEVHVFDLMHDSTETVPLKNSTLVEQVKEAMFRFRDSIMQSAQHESQCMAPSDASVAKFKVVHAVSGKCLAISEKSGSTASLMDCAKAPLFQEKFEYSGAIALSSKASYAQMLSLQSLACGIPSRVALSSGSPILSVDDGTPFFSLFSNGKIQSRFCWPRMCLRSRDRTIVVAEPCKDLVDASDTWEFRFV